MFLSTHCPFKDKFKLAAREVMQIKKIRKLIFPPLPKKQQLLRLHKLIHLPHQLCSVK